jgi:hypothetical protein
VRLVLRRCLSVARQGVPGTVDHDVQTAAAEVGCCCLKGPVDRLRGGDVKRELKDAGAVVREVGQVGGVAGRGDEPVGRLARDEGCQGAAYARGAAGYWGVELVVSCCECEGQWAFLTQPDRVLWQFVGRGVDRVHLCVRITCS